MTTTTQGRKRRRYLLGTLLTLAVGLTLTLTGLFTLTRLEPAHWQAHRAFIDHTTPQQRHALAEQARDKLHTLIQPTAPNQPAAGDSHAASRTRPHATAKPPTIDARETITFTHDQINALIDEELAQWTRQAGYNMPPEITDPMVDHVNGRYVMAFAYRSSSYTQVISAYFDLNFTPRGTAVVRMDSFDAGQLPVPADQMSTYLAQQVGDDRARQIGQWLSKLKHFEFEPVMKLDRGQRVWVENVTATDTGYALTVRVLDPRRYRQVKRQLASVH